MFDSNDELAMYRCKQCPTMEERCKRLEDVLTAAQLLRPALLSIYGAVPECVLEFCNAARAALKS